jgi:hypothetical protein
MALRVNACVMKHNQAAFRLWTAGNSKEVAKLQIPKGSLNFVGSVPLEGPQFK